MKCGTWISILMLCTISVASAAELRKELAPQQGQVRKTWVQAILIGDIAVVGVPTDSLHFLDAVCGLPEQLAAAHTAAAAEVAAAQAAGRLPSADSIDNIVVLGMGGSGISGDGTGVPASSTAPYGTCARCASEATVSTAGA